MRFHVAVLVFPLAMLAGCVSAPRETASSAAWFDCVKAAAVVMAGMPGTAFEAAEASVGACQRQEHEFAAAVQRTYPAALRQMPAWRDEIRQKAVAIVVARRGAASRPAPKHRAPSDGVSI